MSLRDSFVRNVVVHPLIFVTDLLARVGIVLPVEVVEALHDASMPAEPEPEADATEAWEVPAQSPRTAASRALEWQPGPRVDAPEAPAPLAGSAAARMRDARRAG